VASPPLPFNKPMAESQGFDLLCTGAKKWVWKQNWSELRDIQEMAIGPILAADRDVIIAASTAAGKTEAAFLPACTKISSNRAAGVGILYLSPLKALINDQYRRLQSLAELVDISITPWHGDVGLSKKQKLRKDPNGILLITPESLESLLLNRSAWCAEALGDLGYVIVDEFHAFVGTERGCQLQSLLNRLEFLTKKTTPRIALSATLGDMQTVAGYLRPEAGLPCDIIESTASPYDLKLQLRGYEELFKEPDSEEETTAFRTMADDVYKLLRGKSNLIFANSRNATERLALYLCDKCEAEGVPNEFFPHHGNLSKEIREDLESRLQKESRPTSAVCTVTLELGIDIGAVDSIVQVTAPPSVSSLRQRLGRSGRRGQAAVLRMFITEDEVTKNSDVLDRLRVETFQCVAMVSLLLSKWYEPPPPDEYHFSTLVQQTLSVIGQYGGVRAEQLWGLLCNSGPFALIDSDLYVRFLRALGEADLITQMKDGQLVLGSKGERVVEHYTFYAAFSTPEEYRLEVGGRPLGSLPITKPVPVGMNLAFSGRRWRVVDVDAERKVITLEPAAGGRPPKFSGEAQMVHDIVRREMLNTYLDGTQPIYLDETARAHFEEGVHYFRELELDRNRALQVGNRVLLFPWLGDRKTGTIAAMLRWKGFDATAFGIIVEVADTDLSQVREVVASIDASQAPSASELASKIPNTIEEKHDQFLPRELRDLGYGARHFDVRGAVEWLSSFQSRS